MELKRGGAAEGEDARELADGHRVLASDVIATTKRGQSSSPLRDMLRSRILSRVALRRAATATATTGATAATVAHCSGVSQAVPRFVLDGDRYDQNTFAGRLAKIQELIDMRTLLTTDEELAAAQAKLAEFKKLGGKPDGLSDEELWDAQKTVNAIIHGPTGEKMFIVGRMSMFVPMNVPVAAGLLMSKSMGATLFWQWWNQTYNVTELARRTHTP